MPIGAPWEHFLGMAADRYNSTGNNIVLVVPPSCCYGFMVFMRIRMTCLTEEVTDRVRDVFLCLKRQKKFVAYS